MNKEIPAPHITGCENWKCMSVSFCCINGLKVSRDTIQIRDKHTYTATLYFCYTSVTHPPAGMQDISMCRPFWANANCSTQGNLLFLLHSAILLKHEYSPVILLCMHKILLHVHVEISQDVTVNDTWKCSVPLQLSNPSESHYVMQHVYSNSQDRKCTITNGWQSVVPSGQALPLLQVHSFQQQLHNSCETHDHN